MELNGHLTSGLITNEWNSHFIWNGNSLAHKNGYYPKVIKECQFHYTSISLLIKWEWLFLHTFYKNKVGMEKNITNFINEAEMILHASSPTKIIYILFIIFYII